MQKAQLLFIVDNCIIAALDISPPKLAGSSQLLSTSKRTDSSIRASTWRFSAQKQISARCGISSLFCLKKQAVQMSLILCLGHRQVVALYSNAKLQFDHVFCIPFSCSAFQYCPTIHEASLLVRRQTEAQLPARLTVFL